MYYTQALHRAVQLHPDKTATLCGGRRRSFRELIERVARLAGGLRRLGLQPGERVAMLALNSDRYLEYYAGVPWAGGVLNPCNIRWSPAEILYSLEDSQSTVLLFDDAFKPMAAQLRRDSTTIKLWIYCGEGEAPTGTHSYESLIAESESVPDAVRRDDDLLGVFYTGGTTGFPKGVMVSHGGLCASSLSVLAEGLATAGDIYLHAAPMFHMADLGLSGPHWVIGNTHSFIPAFSPEAVVDAIERDRVTHVLLVPTMIQMLVDHPVMRQGRDLSSLKCIVYGASTISEALMDRALQAFPGVDFFQGYGMTELSPLATILPARYHSGEGRKLGKLRSAGRASYCTEVRIVDADGLEVPRGTVGEVAVRGPNVMLGYWNRPEQTAAAVRNGWMHTGDGAYMDEDGFIFVVDRLKDMIISGGENIYSAEVENALAQHAAVAMCAVIGIPSDQWGETVHACVVLKPGQSVEAEALITHSKQRISGYKCPRSVEFVERLPISGAGKVLKTALREPYWKDKAKKVS